MKRLWVVLTLIALAVCGPIASDAATKKTCGSVGLANKLVSLSTGNPGLRNSAGKAQSRVWKMIVVNGPEFTASYKRINDALLKLHLSGALDAERSVLAFNGFLVNLNGTEQQIAIAMVAADFFKTGEGKYVKGLLVAFGPDSSSWIMTAEKGNRGVIVEIVAARNTCLTGIRFTDGGATLVVNKAAIVGLGKKVLTNTGRQVEGDLVEAIATGERWIDFKGIDAGFDMDQLDRVGEAMLQGKMKEFVFAVEEGASIPKPWLDELVLINKDLVKANRQPIRWGIVSGF